MRLLVLLAVIGSVCAHVSIARADRATELEAWLRRERVVSFAANRQVVVVERVGAILFCARAHDGEPTCVIERDPTVHDVFISYDSFQEDGAFHYCISWVEGDGARQWARWDRRAPGTSGTCVEDYNVYGARREAGRAGRFATRTTERAPLYASLDHHATPAHVEGMRVVDDVEAVCFAAPSGWICAPNGPLYLALTSNRLESILRVGAHYLVHATEGHSHQVLHTLALVSFDHDDVRVLDTLTLGHTVVLATDPGPPYTWQLEGPQLVLVARPSDPTWQRWSGELAGRYRLESGRFERVP
ncbi:MAG: hypothetical protein J0L92_15170 [Deltaproteobacteria bacterium]|nr:hypothetical protein [Deltaproteobacteria bacterium]